MLNTGPIHELVALCWPLPKVDGLIIANGHRRVLAAECGRHFTLSIGTTILNVNGNG